MSTKYTPAPWAINQAGSAGRDGKLIYDEIYVYAPDCGVDDIAIASDIADPLGGDGMVNAQLIAAAPELLEALQDLYGQVMQAKKGFGIYDSSPSMDKSIRTTEAAIAKALGSQT